MLILLLSAVLLGAQERPPETCSLSGTVVDSVTGKPLGKVELLLEPVDRSARHVAGATSDTEGRFSMVELDPGVYHLKGNRSGYLETAYGSRRHGGAGTALDLAAGDALDHLEFKLLPAAVIAGTVRDSDGEPLEGAHVVLARRSAIFGKPCVEGFASADTDDRGEYRFGKLPPGKYNVVAEPAARGWDRVDHSPVPAAPAMATITTFYPGMTEPAMAAPIDLAPGARMTGIDILMQRSRVYAIRGRVVNAPLGRLPLTLRNRAEIAIHDFDPHTATRNAAVEFEFRGVPSGSYYVDAGASGVPVTVGGADVDDVRLVFGPGATVHGRVTIEGETPPGARRPHIFITMDGRSGHMPDVEPGGAFTAKNVAPGDYQVRVSTAVPPRLYVKSIRSGDIDVIEEGLTVSGAAVPPLEIVLAADGAHVEGIVLIDEGRRVSGATVLLTPEEKFRRRPGLFQSTTTDQSGRYSFDAVPPGALRLFAWDDIEEEDWNDPEFLNQYEQDGATLHLRPKERKNIEIKVVMARGAP